MHTVVAMSSPKPVILYFLRVLLEEAVVTAAVFASCNFPSGQQMIFSPMLPAGKSLAYSLRERSGAVSSINLVFFAAGTKRSTSKPAAKGEKPESPEKYHRDNQTLLLQVRSIC